MEFPQFEFIIKRIFYFFLLLIVSEYSRFEPFPVWVLLMTRMQ